MIKYTSHRAIIVNAAVLPSKDAKKERVPQSVIDTLLDSVSIIELVEESTQTKKIDNAIRSPCPFHVHSNDNDTLLIDTQEQRVSCDECGFQASGIGWLMYHDGLTFEDALLELASRTNTDLSKWITESDIDRARLNKQKLQTQVAQFYQAELAQTDKALAYFKDRGISQRTGELFALGYSPAMPSTINDAFPKMERQLWNNGLLIRRSDKKYSLRFRDRLMFPIKDETGNLVGFGGRAFDDTLPKYLNSPSSPSFNKSQILYGLHEAVESAKPIKRLILVEGYMDVLTLHEAGVLHPVATLGTAQSVHHLKTLFSHSSHLVVCFDGDSAGRKAATRLLELALPIISDFDLLQFIEIPDGDDPDSFVQKHGRESFEQLLNNAQSVEETLLDMLTDGLDLDTIGGKSALFSKAVKQIDNIESGNIRDSIMNQVESIVGLSCWDDVQE